MVFIMQKVVSEHIFLPVIRFPPINYYFTNSPDSDAQCPLHVQQIGSTRRHLMSQFLSGILLDRINTKGDKVFYSINLQISQAELCVSTKVTIRFFVVYPSNFTLSHANIWVVLNLQIGFQTFKIIRLLKYHSM
jgi:hypothetical protein